MRDPRKEPKANDIIYFDEDTTDFESGLLVVLKAESDKDGKYVELRAMKDDDLMWFSLGEWRHILNTWQSTIIALEGRRLTDAENKQLNGRKG